MERKPDRRDRTQASGFTLLELLVVVTIIVILLALLMPAMDKALTAAEMAKCGSNLKTIGAASINYAQGNQQKFPKRYNYNWDALMFRLNGTFDLRVAFAPYCGLDAFVDPLLPATKLDDGSNPDKNSFACVIYSNYSVYTGWGIATQVNSPGWPFMDKLGDRFAWQDPNITNGPIYKFNLLAADEDYLWRNNYTTASHPDKDGLMGIQKFQDEFTDPAIQAAIPAHSNLATICWWNVGLPAAARGPIDTQFVHDDGSVNRFDNVVMEDERMALCVVTGVDEYNKGRRAQIPPMNYGGGK